MRIYHCPHCSKRQSFFSLKPVLSDRWRCRGCQKDFHLDATCIGSNWGVVAGLWSMPLTLIVGEVFVVAITLRQDALFPKPNFTRTLLAAIFLGGPTIMVALSFLLAIGGYFAGLVYGGIVSKRT